MPSAVFLMYHDLSIGGSSSAYTIDRSTFRAHLAQIADSGATVQTVQGFLAQPAERAVVITFDDGNSSNLAVAAPILEDFGFHATFFLTTGFMGHRKDFMDWPEVRQLADAGMEIGAHGHTHRFLTDLDTHDLDEELTRPREMLRHEVGLESMSMSAPGGRLDERTLDAVRDRGYRSISSSRPAVNKPGKEPQPEFGRFAITQKTSTKMLGRILAFDSMYVWQQELTFRAKRAAKSVIGNRRYHEFWNRRMGQGRRSR